MIDDLIDEPPVDEGLEDEDRVKFCLSCGATHRHGNICPYCESDAQDDL